MKSSLIRGILLALSVPLVLGAASLVALILKFSPGSPKPDCRIDFDEQFRARLPGELNFRELATFEWDEVRTFREYAPLDDVRAVGIDWRWEFDHVPEHEYLIVFLEDGTAVCASVVPISDDYHWRFHDESREIARVFPGRPPELPPPDGFGSPRIDPVVKQVMGL